MKIAAYQAPIPAVGSFASIELIGEQLDRCEAEGVEILCCPEGILGGLADDADDPMTFALSVDELANVLAPIAHTSVTTIIGFTERGASGALFNSAAVVKEGGVTGVYRKCYPAVRSSVYSPGDELPVFTHGSTTFGIVICNDANYIEPSRVLAAHGAAIVFVPLNNRLPAATAAEYENRTRANLIARAVENSITVVAADVTGRDGGHVSYGASAICGPHGTILGSLEPFETGLLVADVTTDLPVSRPGWNAGKNVSVTRAFFSTYGM